MTVGKCKPRDPNQLVKWIVDRSTNEVEGPEAVTGPTPPSDLSQYMASYGLNRAQKWPDRREATAEDHGPERAAKTGDQSSQDALKKV